MYDKTKTDDVIFNFFKQICDEKNDEKCVELGNNWINAMEINLKNMEKNLDEKDKIKYEYDINSNRDHLNLLPYWTGLFPLLLSILSQAQHIFGHLFHHKFA